MGRGNPPVTASLKRRSTMEVTPRVRPEEIRGRVQSGETLLVCAYDDDEKFKALHLDKAISLRQFHELEPSLPKDKELVFYCA
jgi:rhodanese-related sulfurtransferase